VDFLNDNQEDIWGGKVVSAPPVKESTAAESASDIAGWTFRVLIIIGLALGVNMTFTGHLFQPLFQAAKTTPWSKLVVRSRRDFDGQAVT
jgi:hypothetical protein